MSMSDMPQNAKGPMCKAMEQHLASKFCDTLGMSVILYREDGAKDFRCLSSHLCGGSLCHSHDQADKRDRTGQNAVIL